MQSIPAEKFTEKTLYLRIDLCAILALPWAVANQRREFIEILPYHWLKPTVRQE